MKKCDVARFVLWAFTLVMGAGGVPPVSAHLLGTEGVDQYTRLIPHPDGVEIEHDIHYGEVPSAAILLYIDDNRDGDVSPDELSEFLEILTPRIRGQWAVSAGEQAPAPPRAWPSGSSVVTGRVVAGEGGRSTLRVVHRMWAPYGERPDAPLRIALTNSYQARQGTSRLVLNTDALPSGNAVRTSLPTEREYPRPPDITEPLSSPETAPDTYSCVLHIGGAAFGGAAAKSGADRPADPARDEGSEAKPDRQAASGAGRQDPQTDDDLPLLERVERQIRDLLRPPTPLWGLPVILALSLLWGAMHAFTPGHGKTIVGTFLIGSQAKPRHAFLLGGLVTFTHTFVVVLLAILAILMKDQFVYPPWLQPLGAVLIVLVGMNQIFTGWHRLKHHASHHAHAHAAPVPPDSHTHTAPQSHTHWGFFRHSHGSPAQTAGRADLSIRNLLGIGISGGLAPCPAAIVLLLFSWQLQRPVLGLICLLFFGLGLGATLVGVGLLALGGVAWVKRWVRRPPSESAAAALMPILAGGVLIFLGELFFLSSTG